MNTLSTILLQRPQGNGIVPPASPTTSCNRNQHPQTFHVLQAPLLHTKSMTCLVFLLFSLLSFTPSTFVHAAAPTLPTNSLPLPTTKPHPSKTTSSLLALAPTPTLVIPPQCQGCFGPNNTSGMTCFRNTQCVPTQYLCDLASSSTCGNDSSNDSGDDNDNSSSSNSGNSVSILCENQLCNPQNFPPLPYQGSDRIDKHYCLDGSYYALYGSTMNTSKYTASCVEESMFAAAMDDAEEGEDRCLGDWEYHAIGTCFLKTCGPGMDCVSPYSCQYFNASNNVPGGEQGYGLCVDPTGSSSNGGNGRRGGINGGSAGIKYSSQEYLLQGLLIGLCTLALGVGLGVGFWRYKRKRRLQNEHLQSPHYHQQQQQLHLRRRTVSSSRSHHENDYFHTQPQNRADLENEGMEREYDGSMPPPPPLVPLTVTSRSSTTSTIKKKAPTWYSLLLFCFGRNGRDRLRSGRRIGRSRVTHSSSSLNRRSTLELDLDSRPPGSHDRTRRDSRAGESTENETDSQDDSSIHYRHHHHHARGPSARWRWGLSTNPNDRNTHSNSMMMIMLPRPPPNAVTTSGMTVVLPEFEPPPMYHRQEDEGGPILPTYGDISNSSGGGSEGESDSSNHNSRSDSSEDGVGQQTTREIQDQDRDQTQVQERDHGLVAVQVVSTLSGQPMNPDSTDQATATPRSPPLPPSPLPQQ